MSQTLMSFMPSGPRLLVSKLDVGETKVGSIVLPDEAKGFNPVAVVVVEPGEGKLIPQTLQRAAPEFVKGDVVLLARWAGITLTINQREHLIVPEQEILGRAVFSNA